MLSLRTIRPIHSLNLNCRKSTIERLQSNMFVACLSCHCHNVTNNKYLCVCARACVCVYAANGNGAWQHTLCGCCDDMKAFMCSWCCPCIAVGKVAEKLGKSCGAWGCLWVAGAYLGFAPCVTCVLRGDVRQARGIEVGPPVRPMTTMVTTFCWFGLYSKKT